MSWIPPNRFCPELAFLRDAMASPSYNQFHLLLPSLEMRTRLIPHLKQQGISSSFDYLPLHLFVMGLRLGGKDGDCRFGTSQ
jgi:hypothetical protein